MLVFVLIIAQFGMAQLRVLSPGQRDAMIRLADRYCDSRSEVSESPACSQNMGGEECQIFSMTNVIRLRCSLVPFQASPRCVEAARDHTQEMAAESYFDHFSPSGTSPSERMQARGIQAMMYAENIAWDPQNDLIRVMTGWMESDGHRENILDPNLTELGTGLTPGSYRGFSGYFWNQCFHTQASVVKKNAIPKTPTPRRSVSSANHDGGALLPLLLLGGVATGVIFFTPGKKPPNQKIDVFCRGCQGTP